MEHSDKIFPLLRQGKSDGYLRELILYNDNIHSFDYVIDCLIEVCGHEPIQAEQCATLVDAKGSCVVKSAPLNIVFPMCKELIKRNLICEVK